MKIKNFPRFITFLILLFVGVSFITNMFLHKVLSHEEEKLKKITVSQGDSLWSIAANLEGNISENIYHIKQLNHLDSSMVYVGQSLVIPENAL